MVLVFVVLAGVKATWMARSESCVVFGGGGGVYGWLSGRI